MFYLHEIVIIYFAHWVFDFVLQTDKEATGKSHDNMCLISHTVKYSVPWVLVCMVMLLLRHNGIAHSFAGGCVFSVITLVLHTLTDYYTSRFNVKLWELQKRHEFFAAIGFDQALHYTQLYTTYFILIQF